MRNTKYPSLWKRIEINQPNEKKRSTPEKVHAGHNVFLNLANKNVDLFFQEFLLCVIYQKNRPWQQKTMETACVDERKDFFF